MSISSPASLDMAQKLMLFSRLNRDYLNFDAVYSDETTNFVDNPEPEVGDSIIISLRTARGNADRVEAVVDGERAEAFLARSKGLFDYYRAQITITGDTRYYFAITKNNSRYCYNKRGVFWNVEHDYDFRIVPGFKTPDWAKGAVFYQILTDRFYNGDSSNDVADREYIYLGKAAARKDWNEPVANDDVCNFYGGDLRGVMEKMSYLRGLGIEAIYFNPLFVSPSNHKYDVQDYDYIDPHYGVILNDGGDSLDFEHFHNKFATMYMHRTTHRDNLEASNALMIQLIELAHQNGIRVILDGVFNHCGAFNKWLDRENFYGQSGYPSGAYRDEHSRYHGYFRWYDEAWPNNECYDSWWGHDNHPKLYFENSPELYAYILEIGRKWVSPPFNADGWRLDVAADLGYSREFNHRFWRDFRDAVKSANPDAIILAEHYGDPAGWLSGGQWDTIMNYSAFMEPITWFLTGMEKHSEECRPDMLCNAAAFEGAMRYNMTRFPIQSLQTAMNELSNHDHSRFLTRTNKTAGRLHTAGGNAADKGTNRGIMYEAVAMQMTWPGAPTVYYGDEAGLAGWTDPDNRRPYPWGREDQELLEFHRSCIRIRKNSPALRAGSLEYLLMEHGIICYGRFLNDDRVICAFNNNSQPREISVPVWKAGVAPNGGLITLISSTPEGFSDASRAHTVHDGFLRLSMPAYSSVILGNR